ncbi:efflux RND transporter periplasmic adaptor subunit [Intestinicryptomonas porci]|uniref:Efflux RND transporter periplasmic adaptor subunit n=1 Tax=Intestinicryptomonas porci TaxID=2926320 RepID=A0ABU4WF45_9BACT|nr:efflux RND transporter periplasmic adaptor subunit [Opitutales bacterium CLA-KB-P66]
MFFGKTAKSILIVLCAACFVCACKKGGDSAPAEKRVREVVVMTPQKRALEIWDKYTARIEGQKSVQIKARVNGYLEKILFKDGAKVKEGDILFEIDSRPFEAVVEAQSAAIDEIKTRIELAKSNLERAKELLEVNAISREVYETRLSELKSQNAKLLMAEANLRKARLDLEFTKVRAPISGYVSRRYVDEGNLVEDSKTMLADLVSRDVVYAYFEVSERDIIRYNDSGLLADLNAGRIENLPVKLSLMDDKNARAFGKLTYADNKLESSSLEFRAEIENKNSDLYPGMFAELELRAGEPREKLLIPEAAIGTDLVGRFVYIVDSDDIVRYRKLSVGELVGTDRVIEEGLGESDRVVVNGIQRAAIDTKVKPILKK